MLRYSTFQKLHLLFYVAMMDPIRPETGSDDWPSKNGRQNQQVLKFNEYWILNMFFKHKCMLKCYLVIEFSYQSIYNHQSQSALLQHCPNVSSATNAIEVSLKYHWRILHYSHDYKHILKQWGEKHMGKTYSWSQWIPCVFYSVLKCSITELQGPSHLWYSTAVQDQCAILTLDLTTLHFKSFQCYNKESMRIRAKFKRKVF